MANHGLEKSRVPFSSRLGVIHNFAHVGLLFVRQHDLTGSPILLEPLRSRGAGDGDQTLRCNPSERNLGNRAALASSKFLDLVHDSLVLVEVVTLELGHCVQCQCGRQLLQMISSALTCSAKVVRGELIRRLVFEIVYEPAVAERTKCNKGHA